MLVAPRLTSSFGLMVVWWFNSLGMCSHGNLVVSNDIVAPNSAWGLASVVCGTTPV